MKCELTSSGYLLISAKDAERFPTGTVIALVKEEELWIMPVSHKGAGGLLLKYRNPKGDRSVLLQEFLPENVPAGVRSAVWDDSIGALRIPLFKIDTDE